MSGTERIHTLRTIDILVAQAIGALPDRVQVRKCLAKLATLSGDRAVFARCVLTLELALLKDEQARTELPDFVDVLVEAYHDPRLANVLVAGNPELESRWNRIRPVVEEFLTRRDGRSVPPPPPESTPPRPVPRLASSQELVEEIQEIIEVLEEEKTPVPLRPPAPPREALRGNTQPRRPAEPPVEPPVDAEVRAFWSFAERALGRVPDGDRPAISSSSFAIARGSDRADLVRFANSIVASFPQSRHARALAAMTLLYVAGHEKERGLLGVNKERLALLRTGLALIGDPIAAGQVAVLFESDGPATRQGFATVVDLVVDYLGWCRRTRRDPIRGDTAAAYSEWRGAGGDANPS